MFSDRSVSCDVCVLVVMLSCDCSYSGVLWVCVMKVTVCVSDGELSHSHT